MKIIFCSLAAVALLTTTLSSNALPLNNPSFESGNLTGWSSTGDASVQSALGVTPTDGTHAGLITTFSANKPNGFSGNLGGGALGFLSWLGVDTSSPSTPEFQAYSAWQSANHASVAEVTGHAALKTSVDLNAGDMLSFDWNRVGDEADGAFALFYRSDEHFWDGDYAALEHPFSILTAMPLAERDAYCTGTSTCKYETGWQTSSFTAAAAGNYTFITGVFDKQDEGWVSAMWLDNLRVHSIPEPTALSLFTLALAGMGWVRRKPRSAN